MEEERKSGDTIPPLDVELGELPSSSATSSANTEEQPLIKSSMWKMDCSICFKFILIIIILNFMVPPIFIDFYYGIQTTQLTQWQLYYLCNGIVYSLLSFISIVAIASVSDVNRCIAILFLMTSLIVFSFHVVWIVLIFKYF